MAERELKLGIIGLDTSHVISFGEVFNDETNEFHTAGARIVRGFPGGSQKFSKSHTRVEGFTAQLQQKGVEMVGSIDELAGLDGYLLESVDGDQHLEQFRALTAFGKPVFIDKPFTCSFAEAKEIYELSRQTGTPFMTTSCLRYSAGVSDLLPAGAEVRGVQAFGPMDMLPDYRDYFWYGIHMAEIIYSYLGCGCKAVRSLHYKNYDQISGEWEDGRFGSILGNRCNSGDFGATLITNRCHLSGQGNPNIPYMYSLSKYLLEFMKTGISPINPAESLEIIAFLEAASQSLARGGELVELPR